MEGASALEASFGGEVDDRSGADTVVPSHNHIGWT